MKLDKSFILIPIGLFFISGAIAITHFINMADSLKGSLFGVGIGLIVLPLILKRIKQSNY
ncbi:hypothetical protein [Pedobacter foliorum]|uniref:hypothetical protein n=1 Tax=Pedobacter foliorum TaxID=2739058 RepID=UPI0015671C5C|nr:hypothetical protein [Pedobacter foliorum]NRF37617.1 hypothetical protein [Pedobacter foliorum]